MYTNVINSVDGGWSDWNYTECTLSCGAGTKTMTRTCDNPSVVRDGIACTGEVTGTEACNTDPCPGKGLYKYLVTQIYKHSVNIYIKQLENCFKC